jgi:NAD(P)-dependent dehydrogenase (short-subunit alcohol dehydrogenase family)
MLMTTILITGANRGLGLELTKQYLDEGAIVHACARKPEQAKDLIALAAGSKGKLTLHTLDVTSDASIQHLQREIADAPVDILIANAGVFGGEAQSIGRFDFGNWLNVFNVNAIGPIRLLEAFRANLKRGREKKAIAITSGMGSTARHGGDYFAYRSSKAALNNAIKGMAHALHKDGIIVAPIHPGWVRTDMGGANATLSPEESVRGLRKVIADLTMAKSGRFFDYAGSEIPW